MRRIDRSVPTGSPAQCRPASLAVSLGVAEPSPVESLVAGVMLDKIGHRDHVLFAAPFRHQSRRTPTTTTTPWPPSPRARQETATTKEDDNHERRRSQPSPDP